MKYQCKICKGQHLEANCPVLKHVKKFLPKPKSSFSGSSPPEIFVGRYNYPNVFAGVLSPQIYGETEQFSTPELWHKNDLSIQQVLDLRSQLVYGKFKTPVKNFVPQKKFLDVMQEIALASRSTSTEFQFSRPVKIQINSSSFYPIISNQAPVKKITLEENPFTEKRVEYIASDDELKAVHGIKELYKSKIPISNIIKLLSAGLLGLKENRKLVPTRWSITAIDDTLSKEQLKRIKTYQEIDEVKVFHSEYVGNHYEFILLPSVFSFEVLEIKLFDGPATDTSVWQDYESFSGRKSYADSVTGAYYANRLALTEYLEKIKRQASCLVLREIKPEYWAPLGVGILREASRKAFASQPETFNTLQEALQIIQTRIKTPIEEYIKKSRLVKEYNTQKRLKDFF